MAEGISQNKLNSSCGYYHKRESVLPVSRASPAGGISFEFVFSDMEIEELAEGLIRQYLGQQRETPLWVDIEAFLTCYLKLPLKYRSFAEDDLGKIGFISDGITPLQVMNGHSPIREVLGISGG